jgi:glyoxylase I family protein
MDESSVFHHVNLPAHGVDAMGEFYRRTLNLAEVEIPQGGRETIVFDVGGGRELHLTRPVPDLLFSTRHFVNPVLRGHVAFRVGSIEALKQRLTALKVPYADYGDWAIPNCHQVFFHDPEGHVLEAHEIKGA